MEMMNVEYGHPQRKETTSLLTLQPGQWVRILSMPESALKAQMIRIGLCEGERIVCLERLPGGTVVIGKKRQQIAIGHQLAKQILVLLVDESVEDLHAA